MAKDYKHRVQNSRYSNSRGRQNKSANIFWRWLLVAGLIVAFVVFLNMIRKMVPELMAHKAETEQPQVQTQLKQELAIKPAIPDEPVKKPEPEQVAQEEPRFDFYTILPQAETVVPDYEIKARVREELVGKTKAVKYVMQAGSFRDNTEADHQKTKLALLGIQSWIEKAKVGNTIWYRIKIGPYDNPSSVSNIKELLQKNGFGVIVTENGTQ